MSATAAAEQDPAVNGNGSDETPPVAFDFPVASYMEAARHLRRPFTPEAIKFKVQATWTKGDADKPTDAIVVAYIDARLAVERLNLVCPHLWHDTYEPLGKHLLCRLTIDGITREDVGGGYEGKGLYSDALKRAAVKFGVGVSLYAIPKVFISKEAGQAKDKRTKNGPSLDLTPKGEADARAVYRMWLEQHGEQAFGAFLDHGDVEDSQGDPEELAHDTDEQQTLPLPEEDPVPIEFGRAVELTDRLSDDAGLTQRQVRGILAAAGVPGATVLTGRAQIDAAIANLTEPQANKVDELLTNLITPKPEEPKP